MARKVTIEFHGDDVSASRVARSVDGTTSRLGSRMKSLGLLAAKGLAVGVGAAGVAMFKAGQRASDLNETMSKTEQIFGKAATGSLVKWAETADTRLGQSKQTALDAASTFGIFGKAAGLSGKALGGFAKQNTQLAADMASFFNTSPEDAITAIGAAFRGEMEPIRRFGVLLDDASLRQQALKMGLVKTTNEALKPQQKTLAAQALIMQQTKDVQGDFARTSGGLANQQRILKAQLENLATSAGQAVLPVLLSLATFANDTLVPALRDLGAWVGEHLVPALREVGDFIMQRVVPAFRNFGDGSGQALGKAKGAVEPVIDAFQGLLRTVVPIVREVLDKIRQNWGPIRATAQRVFGGVVGVVRDALGLVAAVVRQATRIIKFVWDRWGSDIMAVVGRVFRALGQIVSGALSVVRGIIRVVTGLITGDWSKAWSGVKMIFSGVWGALRGVVSLAWDGIKAAISKGIGAAVGIVKGLGSRILGAVGNLGRLLWDAGAAIIQGLIDGVTSKVAPLISKFKEITSLIPKVKGPREVDRILLRPAGVAIMEGLIHGIESRRVPLEKVLGRVTGYVQAQSERLRTLLTERNEFASGFGAFRSSIFGVDLNTEEGGPLTGGAALSRMLEFARTQRANAERLQDDVAALLRKGVSADLLRQLQGAGESGLAQISALAGGSDAQVREFNALNAATNAALRGAGARAADALYGEDIRAAQQAQAVASAIRRELRALLREQDEKTVIELRLDSERVVTALRAYKRRKGGGAIGLA